MSRALFAGNSVYAKVHILYSKRLKKQDYDTLIECRSVGEAADKLKNMDAYRGILGSVTTLNISRTHLEVLLYSRVYEDINSLASLQRAIGDEFYKYFIYEYDMLQIRNCIACLKTKTESYMQRLPSFYEEKSYLNLYEIARANDIDELVKLCESTPYCDMMKTVAQIYKTTGSLSRCYVPIYSFLHERFASLLGGKRKLKSHKRLQELYGEVSDTDILKVLYRVKRFKGKTDEEMNVADIRATRFTEAQLKALAGAKDDSELLQIIKKTPYSSIALSFDSAEFGSSRRGEGATSEGTSSGSAGRNISGAGLERCADEFLFSEFSKAICYDVDGDECMFTYAGLKKIEMRNIIHIVEGIRYDLPKDEIRNMICGYSSLQD